MPYSYSLFKDEVKKHLVDYIPSTHTILDVGPGVGTYGSMMKDTHSIDALEIFEPYVDNFNLREIYNKVIIGDICEFDFHMYNYLILGDVLEHIPTSKAIALVDKINALGKKCLIAIPYLYEQGEWYGNVHETHHQPDLTHELFIRRYPAMRVLYKDDNYGYYVNYKTSLS
jgi:hypothetical protein